MSGLVSGITKVFTSLGTGAAALGNAVRGVGASLFTASAATGSSMASGGLSTLFGSGSTLGNMISGALKMGLTGGLVGAATSAVTGGDWKTGALYGGLGGAALGGLGGALSAPAAAGAGIDTMTTGSTSAVTGANTPTGAVPNYGGPGEGASRFGGLGLGTPTGAAATTAATTAGAGAGAGSGTLSGLGSFLKTDAGANLAGGLLQGLGSGYAGHEQAQAYADAQQNQLDYLQKKQDDITKGYAVDPSVLAGGHKAGTWYYDPKSGQVVQAGASGTAYA